MKRPRSAAPRRALALLALATTITSALPALAQADRKRAGTSHGARARALESPQSGAFELRVGRYVPNVDDEFSGATPFRDTFGDDNRYLVGIEVDWQLLRIPYVGTLGPGFGWGYTTASGRAQLSDGSGTAAQETSLSVMPMYLVGVLRVDVVARETVVPIVPYVKAGFGYALWWSSDGDDGARDDAGIEGRDTSLGYQFALGGMLLLDIFDPSEAQLMDEVTGVNNAYVFGEYYHSQLDGFDGSDMQVGARTWMVGLALEF